jgi:hypothetical protein
MKGTMKGCSVTISVEITAPRMSLDLYADAIAKAHVSALPRSDVLRSKQEILEERKEVWMGKLVEQLRAGNLTATDLMTDEAKAAEDADPLRDVVFFEEINDCEPMLSEGISIVVVEDERGEENFAIGFIETTLNGRSIDWRYWVEQTPQLTAMQASRLLVGLDPKKFQNLDAPPPTPHNVKEVCEKARAIEDLAMAQGRVRDVGSGWLRWASENRLKVHVGFVVAVRENVRAKELEVKLKQLPESEAAPWLNGYRRSDGKRQVTFDFAGVKETGVYSIESYLDTVMERLGRWQEGAYAVIEAAQVIANQRKDINAESLTTQMENAIRAGKLAYRLNNIPMLTTEIPPGRLWNRFVQERDVNDWLAESRAGVALRFPYALFLGVPRSTVGLVYRLPLFQRIEPRSSWRGGPIAYTDLLDLEDAARFASAHAGTEVTAKDFLRAGAREQIRVRAICQRATVMHPTRTEDQALTLERGSYAELPPDTCRAISLQGSGAWRTYESAEPAEAFGGQLCWYARWCLAADEPDLVSSITECLVTGKDAHAVADLFLQLADSEPEGEQSAVGSASDLQKSKADEALVTKYQLIKAFNSSTGMDETWFAHLKDVPGLKAARKEVGQGGRNRIVEPRFSPFEVMQWLISPKRKKGRKLSDEKAWELLEKYFPDAYARFGIADPRD